MSDNFRDKFAIVGVGITPTARTHAEGRTAHQLEAWAIKLAIEDAGLRHEDIDGAIYAQAQMGGDAATRKLGLKSNFWFPIGRNAASIAGVFFATQALATGNATHVVVSIGVTWWSAAHTAMGGGAGAIRANANSATESKTSMIRRDGGGLVDLGWTASPGAASVHAWYAARHMHQYGTTHEQFGSVAVANRAWANLNPEARFYDRPLSIDDYLASPWVVHPYRRSDNCLVSDIAGAVVVTTAERARALKKKPVLIKGAGFGDSARKAWWDKTNFTETDGAHASAVAFREAGITIDDVDVANFFDCFTAEMILYAEDYGWCKKGEGGPFFESGATAPGGKHPMNTHGGMLSAYHCFEMGNIIESVRQLRGECGDRQVHGAEIAIANGSGGEMILPYMCPIHGVIALGNVEG